MLPLILPVSTYRYLAHSRASISFALSLALSALRARACIFMLRMRVEWEGYQLDFVRILIHVYLASRHAKQGKSIHYGISTNALATWWIYTEFLFHLMCFTLFFAYSSIWFARLEWCTRSRRQYIDENITNDFNESLLSFANYLFFTQVQFHLKRALKLNSILCMA